MHTTLIGYCLHDVARIPVWLLLEHPMFFLIAPPCVKQRVLEDICINFHQSIPPPPLPVHSSLLVLFMYSKEIIYSDGMETSQHAF